MKNWAYLMIALKLIGAGTLAHLVFKLSPLHGFILTGVVALYEVANVLMYKSAMKTMLYKIGDKRPSTYSTNDDLERLFDRINTGGNAWNG